MLSSTLRRDEPRTATRLGWSIPRKALLAGASLAALALASSAAHAACNDNFAFGFFVNGQGFPAAIASPLGTGSSLGALTSTLNTVNTAFLSGTSAFVSTPANPKADQAGNGAWGRVIGGSHEVNTSSTATLDLSKLPTPLNNTGLQTCDSTIKVDFAGFQVGYDVATLNIGGAGASLHFGITAGYLGAYSKDTTPAALGTFLGGGPDTFTFLMPPGSLKAHTEVPFVGAYMAFIQKGFYLDALLRLDVIENHLSEFSLRRTTLGAETLSLTINTGQNFQLGSGWFIEPSAGVVVSRTTFDKLTVSPGIVFQGSQFALGTVEIDDVTSILGRGTLKIGTVFTSQGVTWVPFFAASVFHDFDGDVTAKSISAGNAPNIDGAVLTIQSGGIGTYGQFGLGTSAVIGNTGWLGYGRFDYRTGEHIEGWSINTGIRYQW